MGAEREREDTDPTSKSGTEPGLGPGSDPNTAATVEDELPPPVDFDALHAALGDPLDLDDLPPAAHEIERGPEPRVGDSSGRSSATYASARPHTIPPTRAPSEDLNAPAVIVASEALDTVPTAAPKMTMPVRGAPPHPGAVPPVGALIPNRAPPSSGPHPAAPNANFPATPPQGFAPQRHVAQMTVRMPERPINRRPKTPTVVVRARGPSPRQKLLAFATVLILSTAAGIVIVILQKPEWVGLEANAKPTPSASTVPSVVPPPPASTTPPATSASAAPPPATSTTASVKKTPPAKPPAPLPTTAPAPAPAPKGGTTGNDRF